ncbi:MFS transporter, partial [Clostridium botulinum]
IISVVSWEYIFLINVPIGLVAFIAAMKYLPKDKVKRDQSLDIKGAFLFVICIVALFWAMLKGQQTGYNHISIIISFIISLICFIVFIILELKIENPMLDLSIFKNRVFSVNIFSAFVMFIGISCINIIQPFYLQDVLKLSPGKTGLIMMAYPIVLSIVAPISGYLSDKMGSKKLTLAGIVVASIGLFCMAFLNEQSTFLMITLLLSVVALGNGLFQSPNNSLVMSSVEKTKLGIAGGVNALIRNLGFIFGVSISTTILYNRMSYKIGHRVLSYVEGRGDVFIYGMRWVYFIAAVACILGFLVSLIDKTKLKPNN